MDSNIPHEVEARLRRIEEHVGLPAPGEEEAEVEPVEPEPEHEDDPVE